MSLSSTAVKKTAKTALKGNYFKGVIACSIYIFVWITGLLFYNLISTIAGDFWAFLCFLAFLILLLSPLSLGLIYFTVRLIFSGDTEPVLMFKYFADIKEYKKCMLLTLPIVGNTLFTGCLLFLPAFFTDLVASGKIFRLFGAKMPLWVSGLWGVSAVLKVFAAILLVWVTIRFYLAPFLITADENMDPLEAIHLSKIISRVTKNDFIWLVLSFSWYIFACFFMLPNIFIFPYFSVSYCVHCRFAVAAYNKNVEEINQRNIPSFEVI